MSILALPSEFAPVTHRALSRGVPPKRVAGQTIESAVTVDDAKLHCKIDFSEDNSKVQEFIDQAIGQVELDAEAALVTQNRIQYLDCFPAQAIELRIFPLQSITSITYVDFNGTTQTLGASSYQSALNSRPGLILPAYMLYWPIARVQLECVAVTFVAGYGTPAAVDPIAKQAIYLKVAAAYWDRELTMAEEEGYWRLIDKLKWSGHA